MPKQKAKGLTGTDIPVQAASGALPVERQPALAKAKPKRARKGKLRAAVVGAGKAAGGLPRKAVRKAARKKGLVAAPAAAPTDSLVAKVFDAVEGALPAIARPRVKPGRPGAVANRLERLEIAIGEVRVGGRASPRTRKLLSSGVPKMAQKVIEEAAETAIEAIRGDRTAFVQEAVDLFYNLLALASEIGVPLSSIWEEMDRRELTLGMAEKLPKAADF